jgi:hypothetical protein
MPAGKKHLLKVLEALSFEFVYVHTYRSKQIYLRMIFQSIIISVHN